MYAAVENYFFNVCWGWIDGASVQAISRLVANVADLLTVQETAKVMEQWSSRWRVSAEP